LLAERYRLEKHVAAGSTGQVWRAVDQLLERIVAVKVLRPEVARNPLARSRFLAEARSASRLSHPAVAQVHDFGDGGSADAPFLVMELVDGPSLEDLLLTGPLGAGRTVDVIRQVAEGLHAAHSGGVVHRDIKPANLMITRDGQVKITDFGIASAIGCAPSTVTGTLMGTPAYLAPERMSGAAATPASDLYSLGVVAYECLTGIRPFTGAASEVIAAHLLRPLPPLPATVPLDLSLLVAALTAKDPSDRPRSASEVAKRAAALAKVHARAPLQQAEWQTTLARAGHDAIQAVTLTDASNHTVGHAPRSPQLFPAPHRRRRAAGLWLAVTAALVTASLIGWRTWLTDAARAPNTVAPHTAVSRSTAGIRLNGATFVGLPVAQVLRDLQRLGLRPVLVQVTTSAEPPGIVLAVVPDGLLTPGSVVTVTATALLPQHDLNGGGQGSHMDGGGGSSDGGSGGSSDGGGSSGGH
jgi:serine/threonine-protein kinase